MRKVSREHIIAVSRILSIEASNEDLSDAHKDEP
jgi:hypothetical protein